MVVAYDRCLLTKPLTVLTKTLTLGKNYKLRVYFIYSTTVPAAQTKKIVNNSALFPSSGFYNTQIDDDSYFKLEQARACGRFLRLIL